MLGLSHLFTRTHEFFEAANIFYMGKPELLKAKEGPVGSHYVGCDSDKMVTWLGQRGGLEDLRQKEWSYTFRVGQL